MLESRLMLATHPLSAVPALNSDPTAYAQLYLNFVGCPSHAWSSYNVPVVPAYDQDGDPTTFSDGELASIQEIWARVAEMYSPLNINVTTVMPSDFNIKHALEVTIGGDGSWAGGLGGVSRVGEFWLGTQREAFVFPANLSNGTPKYVADAAAHEAGHAFGLNHQSTYSGTTKTSEYNRGDSLLAPIMGTAYYAARGLWWNGPDSNSSTEIQDDLWWLSGSWNGFGYRPDDHGNTPATASPLTVAGTSLSGSGVIETCPWTDGTHTAVISDKDYFSFTTPAGTVNFNVDVAQYGPMLNAIVELRDGGDNLIATGTGDGLGKTLSATVAAGTYYLVVRGDNTYGDLGQYTISGSVTPAGAPVANAGGPYTVAEGGSVVLSGAASTGTGLTYAWDLNGNGIFGETGAAATHGDETTVSPTYRGVDTGTYTLSLRVTDASNNTSTATTTVTVTNVAPTAAITGAPADSPEGTAITVGSSVTDPGTLDTFAYAWSVSKNGSPFSSGTASTFTFTPDDNGTYIVSLTVTDKDGGIGTAANQTINVTNVAPTVTITGAPAGSPEGTAITLGSTVTDPSTADTAAGFTYAWSVTKNGGAFASGTVGAFSFTPDDSGTYIVSLTATDKDGGVGTAANQTINVTNVAPSPTITGLPAGNTSPEETTISVGVNPNDPGTLDTFTYAWTVTRSGATFATGTAGSFSFTPDAPGVYAVGVVVTDNHGAAGNASASITATHVSYRVTGFTPTASGFDVQLIRPANLSLLKLYTTESAAQLPDVTLVGATVGSVRGSLVWDSSTNTAHFIKTGGVLLPDAYTATLASRPDGWVDTRGEQLDGNADGIAGGDYVAQFTVAASSSRIVSLSDFARGPGQAVNLPATGSGLPIRISDGTGVTSVQLTLGYDASILAINNVTGPAGWSVDTTGSTPGHLVISASGPALASGVVTLLALNAAVRSDAQYGSMEMLRISGLAVNGGAIAATADDAVHKVAFVGDATGDRSYSGLDAADIARVVVGLDTGFAAYPLTDPAIVGDATGDGTLSGLDANSVARESVALSVPEIPDLPAGNVSVLPSGGLDPTLAVGTSVGAPGDVVDVPVNINSGAGLKGVDLTLSYATTVLHLSNTDVVLGGLPAGWSLVRNVDDVNGIVRVSMYDADPLAGGSGPLVDLKFHIAASVPDSSTAVSLVTSPVTASRLNEGRLPLTPVPGSVMVQASLPALNVAGAVQLGAPESFGTVSIAAGGRLDVAAGGSNLLQMASVIINPGGVLDLADNDLVLTSADSATFDTIRQYLSDGRIITSVAEPVPGHFATLAPIDNQLLHLRVWDGATINDGSNFSQVMIKHAWVGDTNLDGVVNADDYLNIIANQGQSGQWITGDLNGDGMVTPDDLAIVSNNLGAGLPPAFGPQLSGTPFVAAPAAIAKADSKAVAKPASKQPAKIRATSSAKKKWGRKR
ncbi:MAG: PKD domain-containing protein [Tepidisphaerales bacterium]